MFKSVRSVFVLDVVRLGFAEISVYEVSTLLRFLNAFFMGQQ